jgi:hypothetical protein
MPHLVVTLSFLALAASCGRDAPPAVVAPMATVASSAPADARTDASLASAPAPMPDGQSWSGVYYNPIYGYLHVLEHDAKVWGRYAWTNRSRWGEIQGEADGNVLRFTWVEHEIGPVASGDAHGGKGRFVYVVRGDAAALQGAFGVGDDESGAGEWDAVKQPNMRPNPDSVSGDPATTAPSTDSWDSADGGR